MKRREVLVKLGGVLLALPAGRVLVACGADDDGGNGGGTGGEDGGTAQTLTFTSSVDQAHSHTVILQVSELTDSPAGGVTKNTSVDAAHLHEVTLSEAELDAIDQGDAVTKTTTQVSGHTHTFTFQRQ